jgi:hypothetical protein
MVEVDDGIAIVRDDGGVENQRSNAAPIAKCAPQAQRTAARRTFVRHFDVES